MKTFALLCALATVARAQPPRDVTDFLASAAQALSNADADAFLDHFDPKMQGYEELRGDVDALLNESEVSSAIEVYTDAGDEKSRTMQLDWVMQVDDETPRRQIVTCKLERQGKKWKIVSLDPISFFKPGS